MKSHLAVFTVAALTAANAFAQMAQPMVGENTTKISDHVWAIMGFPNIAIVVGSRATLVVDTGMGPKMEPRPRAWPPNSRPTTKSSSSPRRTSILNTPPASPAFLPAPS